VDAGATATEKPEAMESATTTPVEVVAVTKTFPQEWTRIVLKSFKLERDGKNVALTVLASAPSAGWKVEIRPLAQADAALAEYEVVGLAPTGAFASVMVDQTAEYKGTVSDDVEQFLVHGEYGVKFPD
jgi:hypothetical protein